METTADGYFEKGWYPGKHTSALKRLGQYASFGMYQPNDAHLSELNFAKAQNDARLKSAEEMSRRERRDAADVDVDKTGRLNTVANQQRQALDQLVMEMTRDHFINAYGMSPEEATQMAHKTVASGQMSKVAGDEADTVQNENRRTFNEAQAPYQSELGEQDAETKLQGSKTLEQEARNRERRALGAEGTEFINGQEGGAAEAAEIRARKAQAQNVGTFEQEFGDIGGPRTQAQSKVGSLNRQDSENQLAKFNADFENNVARATNPDRWKVALDNALTTAELSGAHNKLTRENAPGIAAAQINKAGAMTVPYGGTLHVPLSVGGTNQLQGLKAQGEHTLNIKPNLMGGFTTNQTFKGFGAPAPGTNSVPAGKRLTVEQLQQLLANPPAQ